MESQSKKLRSKVLFEASCWHNPSSTRELLFEIADHLEQEIVNDHTPKFVRVPFADLFVAVCPNCSAELTTDTSHCEKCGTEIKWSNL